jgi:hypothetical protein
MRLLNVIVIVIDYYLKRVVEAYEELQRVV